MFIHFNKNMQEEAVAVAEILAYTIFAASTVIHDPLFKARNFCQQKLSRFTAKTQTPLQHFYLHKEKTKLQAKLARKSLAKTYKFSITRSFFTQKLRHFPKRKIQGLELNKLSLHRTHIYVS